MIFFGCVIIGAVFLPAKICYSHNKMSIWPAFWGAFSILESIIMVIYLKWLLGEIRIINNTQREKISESMLSELQQNMDTEIYQEKEMEMTDGGVLDETDDMDDTMDMSGFV